ncbi:YlbF family regulator [Proteinivorax hydrogeniformans]|uniref:UPF0342 protein PRVXH_002065 n=1 Tax=Proteinivorax hydrogeniformans TaxID=1826727 RepID=A0AAU8HRC7_9FIRM
MNVYDYAHKLVKAVKESEDYKQYKEVATRIKSDSTSVEMLKDFRKRNFELQKLQMQGKEPSQDQIDQIQKLFETIRLNKDIETFLTLEQRIGQTMSDIQKIIGEGIQLEFNPLEGEETSR